MASPSSQVMGTSLFGFAVGEKERRDGYAPCQPALRFTLIGSWSSRPPPGPSGRRLAILGQAGASTHARFALQSWFSSFLAYHYPVRYHPTVGLCTVLYVKSSIFHVSSESVVRHKREVAHELLDSNPNPCSKNDEKPRREQVDLVHEHHDFDVKFVRFVGDKLEKSFGHAVVALHRSCTADACSTSSTTLFHTHTFWSKMTL